MIVVLDEEQAHRELAAAELVSPGCAGQLRQWGFARVRSLRLSCGARAWLRPRRRCADCAVTHVLLPAIAPARHAYAIEVVGQALLASAAGRGHRVIGADPGMPADTRAWLDPAGHFPSRVAARPGRHAGVRVRPDAAADRSGWLCAG